MFTIDLVRLKIVSCNRYCAKTRANMCREGQIAATEELEEITEISVNRYL